MDWRGEEAWGRGQEEESNEATRGEHIHDEEEHQSHDVRGQVFTFALLVVECR